MDDVMYNCNNSSCNSTRSKLLPREDCFRFPRNAKILDVHNLLTKLDESDSKSISVKENQKYVDYYRHRSECVTEFVELQPLLVWHAARELFLFSPINS